MATNTGSTTNSTNNMLGPVIPAGTVALFFVLTLDEEGKPKFKHIKNGNDLTSKTTTDIFLHDLYRYKPEFMGDSLVLAPRTMDRVVVLRKKSNMEWFMVTVADGIDFELIEWGH